MPNMDDVSFPWASPGDAEIPSVESMRQEMSNRLFTLAASERAAGPGSLPGLQLAASLHPSMAQSNDVVKMQRQP
jgi:hypothetical protein